MREFIAKVGRAEGTMRQYRNELLQEHAATTLRAGSSGGGGGCRGSHPERVVTIGESATSGIVTTEGLSL